MKKRYIWLLLLPLLCACDRGDNQFYDFSDLEGADPSAFSVYSTKVTDLSKGLPPSALLPYDEVQTKTTSATINAILANLLEFNRKAEVIELAGTYESWDYVSDKPTRLSGKVLLPKGRKPKRYILVSHYTIGSNAEAPSNCFPLEGVLCDLGYAMIFPDYEGYGVDVDRIHPYLVMEQTASDVYRMYVAVKQFLKDTDYAPEHEDIYLMGFSQGGATTMATQWLMEKLAGAGDEIRMVFAGGGPYDVRETYNTFITSNTVNIPAAIPFVIQGMIQGNRLDLNMQEILQPWLYDKLDEWINSKLYSTSQLKTMIGTTKTSDMLTEIGMDRTSDQVSELYKAMSENSVLALDWVPQAPVYMLHSMDDDVVPFINASKAKSKWETANIQYNFGHYGSHQQCALRFIYTVKTLLEEEGE